MSDDWHRLWQALESAVAEPRHPMRLGALGTSARTRPAVRTVVLRGVDRAAQCLTAYTDARSGKVRDLQQNPAAEWMVYDASRRWQLRLSGDGAVDTQGEAVDAAWSSLHTGQRREYALVSAPGEPVAPSPEQMPEDAGRAHFALLRLTVQQIDLLELGDDRHRRVRFRRLQGWTPERIAP